MLRVGDVLLGRNIQTRCTNTSEKVEWGRSQGAAACPLQEKAANNELVIGEIKEKLTSAISMEVVER